MKSRIIAFGFMASLAAVTRADDCLSANQKIAQAGRTKDSAVRETIYREALAACPQSVEGHYNLSLTLRDQRKLAEAITEIDLALSLKEDPLFYASRAQLKSLQGDSSAAVEDYQQALELDATNSAALQGLSSEYYAQGDYAKAKELLDQAGGAASNDPTTLLNLGVLEERGGHLERALEYYKRAVVADAQRGDAYRALGSVLRRLGKLVDAEVELLKAKKLLADDWAIDRELGLLYDKKEELEKAESFLRSAYQKNSKDLEVQLTLGLVLLKGQKFDSSEMVLKQVSALDPQNPRAFAALGWVQLKQERYAEAEQSLKTALKLDPKNARAHNSLGSVYLRGGRLKEAEAEFSNAFALDPTIRSAYDNLQFIRQSARSEKSKGK